MPLGTRVTVNVGPDDLPKVLEYVQEDDSEIADVVVVDNAPALGTVGSPSADVLTVQGVSGGTALPVAEPDTASASSGEAVDISSTDHTCSATTRALYVGGGGDVIATVGGVDLTFKDVPGGTILPIAATVIKDESTATYMVALW